MQNRDKGYKSCKKDICQELENLTIDDIFDSPSRIKDAKDIRIIKFRIKNSAQHLSKSNGFRLILCCDKRRSKITLFNIYPKRGPLGMLTQPSKEYEMQLKEYLDALKRNTLMEHDISNNLDEIH